MAAAERCVTAECESRTNKLQQEQLVLGHTASLILMMCESIYEKAYFSLNELFLLN